MKLEALTQRLVNGIPPVLKEGSVTQDDLGDRPTHHSVIRITGVAGITRDRLFQVIETVLGQQLQTLHSDADSYTIAIGGGSRLCARVYTDTSEATIATYAGPETRPMDGADRVQDVVRMRKTG